MMREDGRMVAQHDDGLFGECWLGLSGAGLETVGNDARPPRRP